MPILAQHSMEFISRSAEQTRRVGMRLGALLRRSDLVCLTGDLGAGKTTFVQGLAAGWGSLDQVSSPTFVLVNVYRRDDGASPAGLQRLFHLDAYRLESPAEAEALDLDSMLDTGAMVVEWADRIQAALPHDRLWIGLRYVSDTQRDMIFTAHGPRYAALLGDLRKKVFGVI